VKEPANSFYTKISTVFEKVRAKVTYNALIGILVGLAITVMTVDIYRDSNVKYLVKIDNNAIGYVEKMDEFKSAVEAIELTDGKDAVEHITVEKTREVEQNIVTGQDIEKIARETLGLKMQSVAVLVEGEELFKLKSQEEWNKVLEELKSQYMSEIKGDTVSILSSNVKENVELKSALVDPQELLDINGAVQKIIAGKGEQKKYKIKNGDTIWDIAIKNGISIVEIEDANPGVNLDKIKIDQEINMAVSTPYINMEIVAEIKGVEKLAFETNQEIDKNMAKGTSKVKVTGKEGQAEIEKKITVVNGMVTTEDVISNVVLAKPVDKVVVVGGKAPTKSYSPTYVASAGDVGGTGQFSWPSRGALNSKFGARWGRQHTGIDIQASTGTPVHAADSGTVTFAGWSGSYGYLVRISHGNGLETYYAHNSKLQVSAGQAVSKGQVIALSGSTGRSTGPHIHFEVRKNGNPVNPLSYLN
jgi:murein DD-endopeptidase MepM/ murein hydrolase activator NlpD